METRVPNGRMALDPETISEIEDRAKQKGNRAKRKRKELAEKIRNGTEIECRESDKALSVDNTTIDGNDRLGTFAHQWYENEPELLEDEIEAMHEVFPLFEMITINDPRSCWHQCKAWRGILKPGVFEDCAWDVLAIYRPNHPVAQMCGSVCVFLLNPSIEDVIAALGRRPYHLVNDGEGGQYLGIAQACDISDGNRVGDHVTSAVYSLTQAVRWLTACELVHTGDLTMDEFDSL